MGGHADRFVRPLQGLFVARQCWPEADLDAGADRVIDLGLLDHGGAAVARVGLEHEPPVAGGDDERSLGRQHGTDDDAQAVAQRASRRQALELRRDHPPVDAEQERHLIWIDARAIVLDQEAVAALVQLVEVVQRDDLDLRGDADLGDRVESVVGHLLHDEPPQLLLRHAAALLEPFDGPEERPVFTLEGDGLGRLFTPKRGCLKACPHGARASIPLVHFEGFDVQSVGALVVLGGTERVPLSRSISFRQPDVTFRGCNVHRM